MFSQMFTNEELHSAKEHYERAAGVQHHLSRQSQEEVKCHCGRPAAQAPSLSDWLFRNAKAKVQQLAAQAAKCVECYKIDDEIAVSRR